MVKTNKRKIGARILNESELSLILPTYPKLMDQLNDIRADVTGSENGSGRGKTNDTSQKTNNIGIMGARGTGKTSVLKTIVKKLEDENNVEGNKIRNIILPMIVPENMSDSMNLMAAILGLFKKEVDKIEKEEEQEDLSCWQEDQHVVIKRYRNLVKKYCYIQNEYRQVIIGQYTTENDYVKRSSEIFNSDTEFISCFQEFITALFRAKRYKKDAMIFLFIDDIDLSTIRCTDVVKTLLSYLSHPRIITFVSGDLDTFEEALTLDFARQEAALNKKLLSVKFINNQTLKERKKILAYEYLKKVIPPVYRHTVKHWALESRGEYKVLVGRDEDAASSKGESSGLEPEWGMRLASLLTETFKEYRCSDFFEYIDNSEEIEFDKGTVKKKIVPELFHLFDNTSRGLNNVYNVLLDTKSALEKEDHDNVHFIAIKLFLETVVASKPVYNTYRRLLLEDVIQFGNDFETTAVRCNNFLSSIYWEEISPSDQNKNMISQSEHIGPEERFQLFIFMDFAMRVLKKTQEFKEDEYRQCKRKSLLCLINYPVISGSTQRVRDSEQITVKRNHNREYFSCGGQDVEYYLNAVLGLIFGKDFDYALRVYQYIKKFYHSLPDFLAKTRTKQDKNSTAVRQYSSLNKMYTFLYWSLVAGGKLTAESAAQVIEQSFQELRQMYVTISDDISSEARINILKDVLDIKEIMGFVRGYIIHYMGKDENNRPRFYLSQEILTEKQDKTYSLENKNFILNFINDIWGDALFRDNRLKKVEDILKEYLPDNDTDKNRFTQINLIDRRSLWNMPTVEIVRAYIDRQIKKKLGCISEGKCWAVNADKEDFKNSYNRFMKCYDGESYTRARETKDDLEKYSLGTAQWLALEQYNEVVEILQTLAWNTQVWYGRNEAYDLLKHLRSLPFALYRKTEDESQFQKISPQELNVWDMVLWLHAYACYRIAKLDVDSVYKQGGILANFSDAINMAQKLSLESSKKEFEQIIGEKGQSGLGFSEIETLFSKDTKER